MAAYAALVSLSQTTHLNRYQGNDLFSIEVEQKIRSIHEYVVYLQSFFEEFPEKAKRWEGMIRDLAHEAEDSIEDFMWLRIQTRHQGRPLPNLEEQLQIVTEKLGLIAGDVIYARPSDLPAAVSSSSRPTPTANDTIIGSEDELMKIRDQLCGEPSSNLQIAISKTTHATTVAYDHPSISYHFDFGDWIAVSKDYNSKPSLRKITEHLLKLMITLEKLVAKQKIHGSDKRVERYIHRSVYFLQFLLEKFQEKAKLWEGRIRYLVHEAEGILDDWISIRPQDQGRRALPILEPQLLNVTEKLGLIIRELMMDMRPFDLLADVSSSSSSSSSRVAPCGTVAVIGLDKDLTIIRGRLFGQPPDLHIIPIVGMGGIGKTTLARTVYDHPSISYHFDFRAWITVSQDYSTHSLRTILIGLLESMNWMEKLVSEQKIDEPNVDVEGREDLYKKLEKVDVSEMKTKVFQNLKYRRYLIVIDDVWSTEVWDDIRDIFPDDCKGSRIMVTTRLLDIAAYPDSNSPFHEMGVMNDAQSWNLLKQKVFKNDNFPHNLECVGKEIAKSCAGLPLAVILVAGVLSAVNNTRASWEEIAANVKLVVGRDSEEILSLSYTHLPHHLRPCFLYLGGFPEDENIRASRLVKLWEAEGFLKYETGSDKSVEVEAEEYLEDLVKRNLVFVNSRKINGKIRSCSLHDMVRDLCVRTAKEEKFLHVIDGRMRFDSPDMMDERRISLIHSGIDGLLVPSIHTILSFNLKHFAMLLHFLGRFRLLRVLHDASVNSQEFSSQVFELIHLRYLALHGLNITSAISKLVNLETLIIHPTFGQKKRKWRDYHKYTSRFALPSEIWRMQQLKHLILYDLYALPCPPESNLPLINLQTLSLVENLVWNEKMVEMIPNVKRLGLVYSTHQDYHLHLLKYLVQLEKLQVNGCWDLFWQGQNHTFPRTLKKLSLAGGGFPWEDISIIGSLPNLQVLKLLDYACHGDTWETGDEEFPQLKCLLIEASFLKQWIMQGGSFPVLERLVLHSCWDLEKIPEEIGEIETLELITVENCRKSVVKSAKKIQEYQESCGNDALQVGCFGSENAWSTRLNEMQAQFLAPEIGPAACMPTEVRDG